MDHSIYTPGAGHSPPVLAGRDELLRNWRLMLNDAASEGRVRAQDVILAGPRGIGKTAIVTAFGEIAKAQGFEVVNLQAVTGHASLVDALLHRARRRIADGAGPWQRAKQAFEWLGGVSLTVAGVGAEISARDRTDPGDLPDPGDLAQALATLAAEVRRDAPHGGLLITIDELQVAAGPDLALFAAALQRLNVDHPDAAVVFAGTGLPFTSETLRKAGVTHPDRLFDLRSIPLTLPPDDARYAVVEPARRVGVSWEPQAASLIIQASNCYPAHLQLFAHAAWRKAVGPRQITQADVEAAIPEVAEEIERRSLGPRWDRIADREMEMLAALALHGGRTSSASLAATLGRTQKDLSWIRDELIVEGDVYAPRRGELAMAVPLFGQYILAHYEHARGHATTPLLSIDQMRANAQAPSTDQGVIAPSSSARPQLAPRPAATPDSDPPTADRDFWARSVRPPDPRGLDR